MRIAFDHQVFGWQQYGGISRYAYELAAQLATSCGQEVAVISPLYVNRYLSGAPPELVVFGVPAPRLPIPRVTGRFYRKVNSLLARPRIRHFHPDIVHETYYSAVCIAPKGSKVVLTVHDMIHERFRRHISPRNPTMREKALAVERANHVICVSEQTRKDLIELLGVRPEKTSVVHHGFSLPSSETSLVSDKLPARPFLLYVGNRHGHKNFEALLHAFGTSPWLRNEFDLVCFGGGKITAGERNLIRRLGLPDANVRQVSGGDSILAGYYRTARAFVYPSLYEGFGIPLLEAMSFDCPVVCSNASSFPEVVGNAGEMFDPHEPASMRVAIERVAGEEGLRQSLIARGKERLKLFSWKRCAMETLDVYRMVLR